MEHRANDWWWRWTVLTVLCLVKMDTSPIEWVQAMWAAFAIVTTVCALVAAFGSKSGTKRVD